MQGFIESPDELGEAYSSVWLIDDEDASGLLHLAERFNEQRHIVLVYVSKQLEIFGGEYGDILFFENGTLIKRGSAVNPDDLLEVFGLTYPGLTL